jgi:hypothetical protein
MRLRQLSTLVMAILLAAMPSAHASDLPRPIDESSLRPALERSAALYLIRATFDVIQPDEIPLLLSADADALADEERAPVLAAEIRDNLIAEGSYYIVSLRYLVTVGGANWPTDKTADEYDADALGELQDIQTQWLAALNSDGDIRPLLLALEQINAQTEGYVEVPAELDHFAALDSLVEDALQGLKGKPTNT